MPIVHKQYHSTFCQVFLRQTSCYNYFYKFSSPAGPMISAEIVTRTWQKMAQMNQKQAEQFGLGAIQQQPNLVAYILAANQQLFNQTEGEIIYYVAMSIWQMLLQGEQKPGRVQRAHLEQAEQTNLEMVQQLQAQTAEQTESWIEKIAAGYPEPNILIYILESVTEESDDASTDIRPELRSVAVFYLKTVLDALLLTLPPEQT